MPSITLHNIDCLDLFATLPSNSIDCLITDPPYRIVSGGRTVEEIKDEMGGVLGKRISHTNPILEAIGKNRTAEELQCILDGKMFRYNDITFAEWLPEAFRVLKPQTHAYIMTNARNLKSLWHEAERVGFRFVNLLVWKKNNATPNKYYMQQLEFILLLRKGKARNINNMGSKNCLDIPNILGKKTHPTEKPIKLMQTFVENSTHQGDTVLDPFAGTGSTALACLHTHRRFLGSEIDEKYYHIAQKRITEWQNK